MLKWITFISLLAICHALPLPENTEEDLSFTVDGVEHHESRKVEGRIVTLTDVKDGFIVVLDFKRNILMIKNETSNMCFFSGLEEMHLYKNSKIPFMVETVPNEESAHVDNGGKKTDLVIFSPAGQIPTSYVLLTNDVAVTKECSSSPSFWLETKASNRPSKRFFGLATAASLISVALIDLF